MLTSRCNGGDLSNKTLSEGLGEEFLHCAAADEFTSGRMIFFPRGFRGSPKPIQHLFRLLELPGIDIAFARDKLIESGMPAIYRHGIAPKSIPDALRNQSVITRMILKCKVIAISSDVR